MILLDTQAVIWMATQPTRLSVTARRAVDREHESGGLAVASVSLMEMATAIANRRIRVGREPQPWIDTVLDRFAVVVRDLTTEVATTAAFLPRNMGGDPFDRVIVATAICDAIPLVTSDTRIQDSGLVKVIW